ncbi:MAG: carboxypeptidase-like regulatory domain-containing protein [Flavobacteriales bacterium]|nr:carboxypeptidase-like regulatory domain-containing protein [Flavobacteriales bacterium]
MITLTRLTNDIFADRDLSDANLRTFADDHLIRLANKNPGSIYDGLITATTTAYTAYYGIMTNQAVKEAVSEGLTESMNFKRDLVLARMSTQQDLISFLFKADHLTYQQFFPQGMTEYINARLDNLTTILDRYLVAMNANMPVAHATEVNDITNLINDYKAARTAQRDAFSETDILRTGRRETRKALTLQITRNILTLAIDFLDDPDGFDDYYDDSLLPKSSTGNDDGDDGSGNGALTVNGMVKDPMGMPINGATVTLGDGTQSITVTTGPDGKYTIDIPQLDGPISAPMKAEAPGFMAATLQIELKPGENQSIDLTLTSAPPMP